MPLAHNGHVTHTHEWLVCNHLHIPMQIEKWRRRKVGPKNLHLDASKVDSILAEFWLDLG